MSSKTLRVTISGHPMAVTLRPKSTARPVIIADYTLPDGRRRRIETGAKTLQKALDTFDALVRAVIAPEVKAAARDAGRAEDAEDSPTIASLADWYTASYLPYTGAAHKTITKAAQVLRELELYCRARHIARVQQLTMDRIIEFCQWIPQQTGTVRAPKTTRVHLGLLRSWLNAAHDTGRLQTLPVTRWVMPAVPRPQVVALTRAEVLQLLNIIRQHDPDIYPPILLMANTGFRPSDALDLRWSQVAADRITRTQTKTGRTIQIPITPPVREALALASISCNHPNCHDNKSAFQQGKEGLSAEIGKQSATKARQLKRPSRTLDPRPQTLDPSSRVFPHAPRTLYRRFRAAAAAGGFPKAVHLKLLRTSYATWLADSGCNPKLHADLMGHADITMTLKYYVQTDYTRAETFLQTLHAKDPATKKKPRKP